MGLDFGMDPVIAVHNEKNTNRVFFVYRFVVIFFIQ